MAIGDKYGRWTVVGDTYKVGKGNSKYYMCPCVCECGTEKHVRIGDMRQGKSMSCGCYHSDVMVERNTTHNMTGTRIFDIYNGMLRRCTHLNAQYYYKYSVLNNDPKWLDSFENFYEDMGSSYEDGLSLDRIDSRQGYFKENCRWATPEQQGRNQNKSVNNKSGVTGVCLCSTVNHQNKEYFSWIAIWREDGKMRRKSFAVLKYGYDEAFAMAVEYRKKQIERLNELGYGYTPTHGL